MRISDWSSDVCSSDLQPDAISRMEAFVAKPYERIDYTDAIEILKKSGQKFEYPVAWGIALKTEQEQNERAACGERVGQDVESSVVGGVVKKKKEKAERHVRVEKKISNSGRD